MLCDFKQVPVAFQGSGFPSVSTEVQTGAPWRPRGHLASTTLVRGLQALSFPLPKPHKAKGRLTPYNFPLERAYPPVLLLDPKVASYLSDLWHASNPLLRPHSKTFSKTPIYSSIFAHTQKKYQNFPIPHSLMSPCPMIWSQFHSLAFGNPHHWTLTSSLP